MRRWQDVLQKMVNFRDLKTEVTVQLYGLILPPKFENVPANITIPPEIHEFYSICDGGYILDYHWNSLATIRASTDYWINLLEDDILSPEKHFVFATDSGGAPLIWNAAIGEVATYWWKGGQWEPEAASMGEFLKNLFNPPENHFSYELLLQFDSMSS